MENIDINAERVILRYRRLWEDYFPTSHHSSTPVSLTACLTEATILWNAAGGAILTGNNEKDSLLYVAAVRNAAINRGTMIAVNDNPVIARSFSRGRLEIMKELESDVLVPGITAKSAVSLPIISGSTIKGVFLLWSDEPAGFKEPGLSALPLFAHYVAVLLEVDEFSERLGENLQYDPLTGLVNRKRFDRVLADETARATRYAVNLSLVVLDIDDFSDYNSRCGHMMGNLALSDISSLFAKEAREVDTVARIGPDEFAVILPETTGIGAIRFADRLRTEVAQYPFPVSEGKSTPNLTICAGVANIRGTGLDDKILLMRALEALDAAKAQGPGNIEFWKER